ncbi:hypothetical protein DFH08DRAFT_308190, partial [Mycena albidolilacea]
SPLAPTYHEALSPPPGSIRLGGKQLRRGQQLLHLRAPDCRPCRVATLNAMQGAGMKILRTWVTGVGAGQKASNISTTSSWKRMVSGSYDDIVLSLIDQLMVFLPVLLLFPIFFRSFNNEWLKFVVYARR